MRKFYSIVLMAAALLIGTNMQAVNVTDFAGLQSAITAAEAGTPTSIVLSNDIDATSTISVTGGKKIEIDLNGNNIDATSHNGDLVEVINGSLKLTNSKTIGGLFNGKGWAAYMVGSNDDVANYSVLTVGKGVTLTTTNGYGVVLYQGPKINNATSPYGYGLVFDLYGEVRVENGTALWVMGNIQAKTGNIPQVNIHAGATIVSSSAEVCLYGGGYAQFNIEGTVEGGTGIYAKAGDYNITGNAVVRSTATTHEEIVGNSDGYTGGIGCAIVSDSKAGYAGGMEIAISGNATLESNAEGGFAIEEVVSDQEGESKTESIVIESGTINGNLKTTAEVKENIVLNGTITGGTFNQDITEYLSNVTGIITPTTNEQGNIVYVVEEKPAESDPWLADIATADADDYVRLTGSYSKTLDADAQAKYLVMQDNAKIIIPDGKKLTAGEIVMGKNTVIEVMAGGKLIITDAQGLVANFASNIVLHATEGNQSTFIMDPSVASNKNPKATVEFVSKAYYNGSSDYRNQRFGIPTIGALDNITADHTTRIWGYFNGQWDLIGTVVPGEEFDASVMDKPFAYYQMNNNNPDAGTKVTMTGRLVGVSDPALEVTANNWATFSNSFMADMNAQAMMAMFDGHDNIDATLQTYVPTSESSFAWQPYNRINILFGDVDLVIQPMQAFIIKNNGAEDQLQINYNDMVWEPFVASLSAGAPRKRAALDMTTARIQVSNAAGVYDFVTLVADNQFSAEYENGYDAEHVMNNTLDLYTVGVKNLATMATDNLDNTVLGLSCAEAGEYTISFSHINGDNLTLIDRATGARIAMVEGNTYDFTVEAGEANRFEIVGRANMPTAIENTDAKNVKGAVYTITGQYVGSVENWNVLPAGVYVIDGVKCVK